MNRNDRAWQGYDNWLLRNSGVYDETPEVFETEEFKYFSCYEENVETFDKLIKKAKKDAEVYLDLYFEDLATYADALLDDINLHNDEYEAIQEFIEDEQQRRMDAAEYKAEQRRESTRD